MNEYPIKIPINRLSSLNSPLWIKIQLYQRGTKINVKYGKSK